MKIRLTMAAALLAFFTTAASAQLGVYAGFSGAQLTGSSSNVYGPLFGAYLQKGSLLQAGLDLRGSFLTHNSAHLNTGAIGPRIAFKPIVLPFKPYAEALVGIANYSTTGTSGSTHLNYQLLAGLDTTILPRIDWRIIEFDYSVITSKSINAKILTTGIVFRLP